jgi:hypothetical protein
MGSNQVPPSGTPPGGPPVPPPTTPTPSVDPLKPTVELNVVTAYLEGVGFGSPGAMEKANEARMSYLYKMGTEIFELEQDAVSSLGRGTAAFDNLRKGTIQVYEDFYTMSTENSTALHTFFKDQNDLVDQYMGIMDSRLMSVHGLKKDITATDMANLALQKQALGLSSQETENFLARQFALTGDVNDDLLKQTLAYSNVIEEKTGISSKIIAGNISDMMSNVELFGNMTVEEMSQAAAAIAKVGLEVNDVASMVKKFNTFEGAAESVSKLTQTFGVQLDTMKLMTAANESPEALALMLQESFDMAGVDMSSMDMPAKRMLASALGGIGVADVEKLLGPAGQGLSQFASDVEGVTGDVSAVDISTALKKAESDIEIVNRRSTSAILAAQEAAALSNRAMVASFSSEMDTMQNLGTLLAVELASASADLGKAGESLAKDFGLVNIVETMDIGGKKVFAQLKLFRNELGSGTSESLNAVIEKIGAQQEQLGDTVTATRALSADIKEISTAIKEARAVVASSSPVQHTVNIENIKTVSQIEALVNSIKSELNLSDESAGKLSTMIAKSISENVKAPVLKIQGNGLRDLITVILNDELVLTAR